MASDPINTIVFIWESKILEFTSLILENILFEETKGYNFKLFCCLENWYIHVDVLGGIRMLEQAGNYKLKF